MHGIGRGGDRPGCRVIGRPAPEAGHDAGAEHIGLRQHTLQLGNVHAIGRGRPGRKVGQLALAGRRADGHFTDRGLRRGETGCHIAGLGTPCRERGIAECDAVGRGHHGTLADSDTAGAVGSGTKAIGDAANAERLRIGTIGRSPGCRSGGGNANSSGVGAESLGPATDGDRAGTGTSRGNRAIADSYRTEFGRHRVKAVAAEPGNTVATDRDTGGGVQLE